MDYSVFDQFCRKPTWHTSHPSDERNFSAALRLANKEVDFSPEKMGQYIQENGAKGIWPKTDAEIEEVIRRLVKRAKAARRRKADANPDFAAKMALAETIMREDRDILNVLAK